MRLAILTGGSRGLGASLCNQLSEMGWQVVEFSRTAPHPFSVAVDLASPESFRETVAATLAQFAPEGVEELLAIHNAGTIQPIGPTSSKDPQDVLANLNANLVSGIVFLTEIVARFQGSRCRKTIVNISSGAAQKEYFGWSLYCAAKAGLEHFVRTLAVEQGAQGHPFLAVNVDPGVMDTGMQALIRSSDISDFPTVERFVQFHERGALAAPADVAAAVLRIAALPDLQSGQRHHVRDHAA